ncbi:MAG: hypothetical protein AAF468_08145 [Pseudomonadota bacterium]
MKKLISSLLMAGLMTGTAQAGGADVVDVKVRAQSDDSFSFSVTVAHGDEGWEHYADSWQVLGSDGTVFGTRVLAHPHVDEQPFTRSKSGIKIPAGVTSVLVRAGDSVHGYSGKEMTVNLPGR